jgi:hypothetical protein
MSDKLTVTLSLKLDYRRPKPESEIRCPNCAEIYRVAATQEMKIERRSDEELTVDYIRAAIETVHPRIDGQLRRTVSRLYRALDAALDTDQKTVEIERAGFDLLRDSLRDKKCEIQTNTAKYFVVFEEEVDRAAEELKGARTTPAAALAGPAIA